MNVLEVEKNAEGSVLAVMGREGANCGYRIAGPKAWGGSRSIAKLKISDKDLAEYINCYAPEVKKLIKA